MRIGIFFCQTIDNRNLNIDAIAKYSANLPEVETVQILRLKPLPDIRFLSDQIRNHKLERIVIAGDVPGYYKPAFTRAMAIAGGNTDEIRLASFQEHGARGEDAMDRAKAIVACATMGSHPRGESCQSCNSDYWRRHSRDTICTRNSQCRKAGIPGGTNRYHRGTYGYVR
jgi:heterodisulfide reductase subunit A-like polyferredoxin